MRVLQVEEKIMKPKRISVSRKRQITIPLEYYKELNIQNEVECIMKNDSIIIRPVIDTSKDNFADLILEDLITEGYKGKRLLEEFKKRKQEMKYAVENLRKETDKVAEDEAPYETIDKIFEEEE